MKHKLLFLATLLMLICGKSMAQSDTTSSDDTDDEEVYNDYPVNNTKLDTPVFKLGLYGLSMPFNKQQAFGAGLSLKMNYRTDRAIGVHLDVLGRGIKVI